MFGKLSSGLLGFVLAKNIDDTYVDICFNVDRPINQSQLIKNCVASMASGQMSKQTAMERNPLIIDVSLERERIKNEKLIEDKSNADIDKEVTV